MLTPQQNLEEADRLLKIIQEQVGGDKFMTVTDTIALANSRIALAQALHMVQLAEKLNDALEEPPRRYGLADIEYPGHR